jgi:hypothetical protein
MLKKPIHKIEKLKSTKEVILIHHLLVTSNRTEIKKTLQKEKSKIYVLMRLSS